MKSDELVEICLATYNGEKYLGELYNSLAIQTHSNWKLIIRDDGSADNTLAILENLEKIDARIKILHDKNGNVGVIKNFELVLMETSANIVMLADQDDVWLENKIEKSLALLTLNLEPEHPKLVFTDLEIVDSTLSLIEKSFIESKKLTPLTSLELSSLIVQNVAPGCTMMFNRALIKLALPFPDNIAMHDWWLLLVALVTGKVSYLNQSTILYRQHDNNVLGAGNYHMTGYKKRLTLAIEQSKELRRRFIGKLKPREYEVLRVFSNIRSYPIFFRQLKAIKIGLKKSSLMRNIIFYIMM